MIERAARGFRRPCYTRAIPPYIGGGVSSRCVAQSRQQRRCCHFCFADCRFSSRNRVLFPWGADFCWSAHCRTGALESGEVRPSAWKFCSQTGVVEFSLLCILRRLPCKILAFGVISCYILHRWNGSHLSRRGMRVQKIIVTNPKDGIVADASIVVLLVSFLRWSQLFIHLLAKIHFGV